MPVVALSCIMLWRVASRTTFHDRWSTPRPTTTNPISISKGRSLPPTTSARSNRSQKSLAIGVAAVDDRSLILSMQCCSTAASLVLTVIRGSHTQSVICGSTVCIHETGISREVVGFINRL